MKKRPFLTTDAEALISHIEPGDVLLFDSIHPLSELIQFAENRPVNHAALYLGNGEFAQVSRHTPAPDKKAPPLKPAARKENLRHRLHFPPGPYDRTVTALRHVAVDSGEIDAQAIVDRAKAYVDPPDTTYSYLSLIALMVPSIFRTYEKYFVDPGAARRFASTMRAVSRSLLDVFDADVAKPTDPAVKKTLTCSEFVYRCFEEAQPKLRIEVLEPLARWDDPAGALRKASAKESTLAGTRASASDHVVSELTSPGVVETGGAPGRATSSASGASTSTSVSGDGFVTFHRSLRTNLVEAQEPATAGSPTAKGTKIDLAVLAAKVVLDLLKHNVGLSKYGSGRSVSGATPGDVVPDTVTPRDLWSSPSLTAVSILHRPPSAADSGLDDVQLH